MESISMRIMTVIDEIPGWDKEMVRFSSRGWLVSSISIYWERSDCHFLDGYSGVPVIPVFQFKYFYQVE